MAKKQKKSASSAYSRIKAICLSLPDTKETMTWGSPHFRVGEKIFAGFGEEHGKSSLGFKLEMDHADMIVQDPRFSRAPYVGHKGWVSMDTSRVGDWNEVRELIFESYRLIAPKRSLAKLGAEPSRASVSAKKRRRSAAKRRKA